jgi:hypothetical protein
LQQKSVVEARKTWPTKTAESGYFIYIPSAYDRHCQAVLRSPDIESCFQIMGIREYAQTQQGVCPIRRLSDDSQNLAICSVAVLRLATHSRSGHLFHPADQFGLQGMNLCQKFNAEWLCGLREGLCYMQVTTQKTASGANPLGIWWRVFLSLPKLDRAACLINRY